MLGLPWKEPVAADLLSTVSMCQEGEEEEEEWKDQGEEAGKLLLKCLVSMQVETPRFRME